MPTDLMTRGQLQGMRIRFAAAGPNLNVKDIQRLFVERFGSDYADDAGYQKILRAHNGDPQEIRLSFLELFAEVLEVPATWLSSGDPDEDPPSNLFSNRGMGVYLRSLRVAIGF